MLHVHRATRADRLADALAGLLAAPPADPFATEVVAVHTRGMERWLSQRMSAVLGTGGRDDDTGGRDGGAGDGICANVAFPTPHRLVADAVATASGIEPTRDPWLPERCTWTLLEVVDACLTEPWLAPLARYLGALRPEPDPVRRARRLGVVRHLATLFDRYAMHRPEMLAAWAAGSDGDGDGQGLAAGSAWQAELWRRLRDRIAAPDPARRRAVARERIAAQPRLLELPGRIALFGLTRLPAGQLEVLSALAAHRDVHLFLLHPSPALWAALREAPAPVGARVRRDRDPTATAARNRLLASWGRDAREMQLVLAPAAPYADRDEDRAAPDPAAPDPAPATLLQRLQAMVRADAPAPDAPFGDAPDARPALDPDDRSIVVHSCHGRARQVEVLRDAILHALADDPGLEPRDVIVMCPDVEAFAPLIGATFGAGEELAEPADDDRAPAAGGEDAPVGPTADLRVRLADRSLTQTNPVLAVVAELLALVGQRLTASQVLDLADRSPVRRRFAFDDDALGRLRNWIGQSGIRWGLDAEHRAPFDLADVPEGTWRSGLDRLLLGVAMTEDDRRLFAGVLPLDDVDSRAIELAGRLAELIERLRETLDLMARAQPPAAWTQTIALAADLLTATGGRERWQRAELQRVLDELAAEAGDAPAAIAPAEMRALLQARLAGRPTRASFRTGHLTICTLEPMRSVPHRIVCLLGLDDGAFPRKRARDGDDLMLADPLVGERDPRSEDRQLLLDALMAAGERLIVTFTGNDERTNAPRPPAVPVGELLDAIDATVRCADGAVAARDRVLVRHPLQPFDPANYTGARPWSFDAVALHGARSLTGPRARPRPFLTRPLAPLREPLIELADLVRFVEFPVRAFLRRRLGIALGARDDDVADGLAVALHPLERWDVGQRLLDAILGGTPADVAARAEQARGLLPPGQLHVAALRSVANTARDVAAAAAALAADAGGADPLDVRVALPDGRLLSGTVSGLSGDRLLATTYSRVAAKHRLAAWVRLLALTAAHPERPFEAVTVGRGTGSDVRRAWLAALGATPDERARAARAELERVVDLYDRGMREPLPIFCRTSAAYAEAARRGAEPVAAAEREWASSWVNGSWLQREDAEPEHALVLGGTVALAALRERAPAPGEAGDGWAEDEDARFGRLARRLWDGPLRYEEIDAR